MASRSRRAVRSVAFGVVAVASAIGCSADRGATDRQASVASRGAQVMPFDLEATTHTFTKTGTGGVQVVRADDPGNTSQISLIRQHLHEERANFTTGDFSDPATIHGMDMPGVSELSAGYAQVTVTYADRSDGAQLTYAAADPELIDAVHAWFDRQVMDHGSHAETGH